MNISIVEKLFQIAKSVAPVANAKIVSAIVYKNSIYSLASNSYKTHPKAKEFHKNPLKCCLHAEMAACIKASYHLSKKQIQNSDIYVIRAKRNKTSGLAKPCKACEHFIRLLGIKNIIYSVSGFERLYNYGLRKEKVKKES